MSIVAYISRDTSGTSFHGTSTEGTPSVIDVTAARDVSLNLSPSDVEAYARVGNDLHVNMMDGTQLQVQGFYDAAFTGDKNLFLSDDGSFIEVVLEDRAEGLLFANYEPLDISGKWSAYDDMVFLGVDRVEPVIAPLVAPALGGLGLLGAGAAAAGVAALAGGSGDDDGDDGSITPTVDDPDGTLTVAEGDEDGVTITGTGEAGSTVDVTIGDSTGTTTVGDDGTWSVDFPTDELPDDGVYDVVVDVVAPDDTTFELDGPTVDIDTTPPEVEITEGTQSVGDLVNGDEQSTGTIISGTGEAGATVSLEIDGSTQTTTVAEDGTWSVTFTADEIATGEYETPITITTTDPHGNSAVTTDVLEVDTLTSVSIDSGLSGGDDIVNAAEAAAGVAITGTAEAGSTVDVTIEGVTRSAVTGSDGVWSVTYEAGTLPNGEYTTDITVTSTDLAGNTATDTSTIDVDTDAGTVALSLDPIEGDDVINASEREDGVTITGTATPGEEVTVTLGTASGTVVADADGNWSFDFEADEIPEGTDTLDVTATITDEVGNTETDSDTVGLDTEVLNFTSDATQAGDDIVNQDELTDGFTLTGTVEAGSAVAVEIQGVSRNATVDEDGNWSVTFDASDLAEGTYDTSATITATDAAGNAAVLTQDFSVDTEVTSVDVFADSATTEGETLGLTIVDDGESYSINTLDAAGDIATPTSTLTDLGNNQLFSFDAPIASTTNLIVTAEDDAGNSSSTLTFTSGSSGTASDLAALSFDTDDLSDFNVDTLELGLTENTSLELTEEAINALSDTSDTLTIRGTNENEVTLTGATADGTETVDGETFNVYTIGDDGTTLLVEDDVNVVI